MKNYNVTLWLITGYEDGDLNALNPITKQVEYLVSANTIGEAKLKARGLDESKLSVWDSDAEEIEIPEPISSDNKVFGEYDNETINQYALFDNKSNEIICDIHGTQKHAIEQVKSLIVFFNKEVVKPFTVNTITRVIHQDITFKYKRKSITLVKQ